MSGVEKSAPDGGHVCLPCRDGRLLLLAALALRVVWALASRRFWGYREDGLYDDAVYILMARGFLAGGSLGYQHPPVYPLFLAGFLSLGAWGLSLARWVQLLLSAAAAPLAYRISLALKPSRAAALIAGAFMAVNPMLIYFSARMMSEVPFVFLFLAFLLAWLQAWRSGRLGAAALSGFLGGAATLTRGVIMPFGGVLALVALLRRREQPRWALLVAVCGLCWAGTVAPWTARNWVVYHHFIPVSIQGGWNFYEGQTVDPEEIRYGRPAAMGAEARALGLVDPIATDAYFSAKAKAFIRDNPREFLRLCAIKACRFWRLAPEAPHGILARLSAGFLTLLLFSAALLGLRATARLPGAWFLFSWVLFLNLLHSMFVCDMRYRLPIEPVLAVMAGVGLARRFPGLDENP
jgi:4-amino-4-deoxy-L-arabinose transferase-like glycosyltransferase